MKIFWLLLIPLDFVNFTIMQLFTKPPKSMRKIDAVLEQFLRRIKNDPMELPGDRDGAARELSKLRKSK